MKTCYPSKEQIVQSWRLLDAEGMILGRLATQVSSILRGKDKPIYTPALDTGDYVVVVNAEKVTVTGNKLQDKVYYRHSQYPGGLKATTLEELKTKKPEEVIKKAVWGMLPKGRLGRKMFKKLKVYAGDTHPHESQIPGSSLKTGER